MANRAQERRDSSGAGVNDHLAKIEALKESLKHARGMSEEMRLLNDLTQEISALRQCNEPHYQ